MQHSHLRRIVALVAVGVWLAACGQAQIAATINDPPAKVEPIAGTEINRVVLTARAVERLGIQTVALAEVQAGGVRRKSVPYAAVIYDLRGQTWVYTSPAAYTFVRQPVTVDAIEGDQVLLTDGPPVGMAVVTVGVAELYGIDTGIGK